VRLSVIIPVLNSHEVVRRQILHWQRIGLPKGTEIILVDDGSDPPIQGEMEGLRILRTNDTRPWTWALARNAGAKASEADYLLMVDLDHILSRDLLDASASFTGHRMQFYRQFGVLDEDGTFTQDIPTLISYGLEPCRIADRGVNLPPHPNMFVMRRDVFWDLGGYREDLVTRPYPQGEDSEFKRVWHRAVEAGRYENGTERPILYMIPNGKYCGDVDADPCGLFHSLTRKTRRNPFCVAHA